MKKIEAPWAKTAEELAEMLDTHISVGLTQVEADERIKKIGLNLLSEEKKKGPFIIFFSQLKSPLVGVLLFAAIVTALLQEYSDSIAILIIVFLNSIIGFIQESKAEDSINALKKLSSPFARVLRNAEIINVKAEKVCIGDIVFMEGGDHVPADCRVIISGQLSADESILTGESLPVNKISGCLPETTVLAERKNMLFAGTAVTTGTTRAIVISTGMNSEIGRIAKLINASEAPRTPLQLRLEQVSFRLLVLACIVVVIVSILGLLHKENLITVLMNAISLAVAAIPEGLPTVVSVALALAVRRMTKKNAIVRHLPAVETLGSTSVICTDKTGTLTTGKMRVRDVLLFGNERNALVESGVICSNATVNDENTTGDPTEVALLYLAKDESADVKKLNLLYPRIYEWSFDSNRKRMSVAVRNGSHYVVHTKGAPEAILEICQISDSLKKDVLENIQKLSSQGQRLLAFSSKKLIDFDPEKKISYEQVEYEQNFMGLVSISDPPRDETISAIKICKESGIKIVMITGDHPSTAKAIANELGITEERIFDKVITGNELDKLSPVDFASLVEEIAVYARVTPEHKVKIVEAWQNKGHVVAMTGDGVNDAPALKKATIGVSMGKGGTEVAKQASSIILTDDNFATIVTAVQEGRAIFGNIRRTIQYLLSGNLSEILIMLGAAIAGWPAPLAPIHLLWINLVTDGLPSLALAAEPVDKDVLKQRVPSSKNFFDKKFYSEMVFIGLIISSMALALYGYLLNNTDEITARTHVFSFLVFSELFRSFACRNDDRTFFQVGMFSNFYHLIAVSIPLLFQIWLHHSETFQDIFKVKSLSWNDCMLIVLATLVPVTCLELRKLILQKKRK